MSDKTTKYRGYIIEPNLTGYVNFDFYLEEAEEITGNGTTEEDCKLQIDELLLNEEDPIIKGEYKEVMIIDDPLHNGEVDKEKVSKYYDETILKRRK